jgi:biopolymer transport protein ExbD/biopolymer transport protein TolR
MGAKVGGDSAYNSDINVTPLVDIMLVVLIIFMVITPLLGSAVAVTLPKSKNPIEEKKINSDKAVIVSIPENHQWYVGKDQMKAASDDEKLVQLGKEVKDKIDKVPKPEDKVVYIKCTQDVQYQYLVMTIDAIRNNGMDRIGLVVDKEKEGGGSSSAAPAK